MIYSGDVRPFGADVVFMRLRRNRPCTLRGKISFCWCSSPAPRTEASGGQGASPLEPDRQGAGADGGLRRLYFHVLATPLFLFFIRQASTARITPQYPATIQRFFPKLQPSKLQSDNGQKTGVAK